MIKAKSLLGVLSGFLFVLVGLNTSAQSIPTHDYSTFTSGNINGSTDPATKVCPSTFPLYPSTSTFYVTADLDPEITDNNEYRFRWAVYGGWITHINGVEITVADHGSGVYDASHNNYLGVRYAYFEASGIEEVSSEWRSFVITVEWGDDEFTLAPYAWAAVQQSSLYGCTDGFWSVFTNPIFNNPPNLTAPANLILAYGQRFIYADIVNPLPLPAVDDDGCPVAAPFSYSLAIENPVGTPVAGITDHGSNIFTVAELPVGTNTLTWTVSDGHKESSVSYTIVVEPQPQILNVAWINPRCLANNGSVYVSALTAYTFSGTTQYSFDGGTSWQDSPLSPDLAAGAHTVQARITYTADAYIQESPEYDFELHATATTAIPASGPGTIPSVTPHLTVKKTSCGNASDGEIWITESQMVPTNKSLTFDGNDYLLLNKAYTGVLTEFSAAAWVKTSTLTGTILSFNNSEYYQIGLSNGYPRITSRSTDNASNTILGTNPNCYISDGYWHLIVATFDNGIYNLYVDGISALENPVTGNGAPSVGKEGFTWHGAIGAAIRSATFQPVGESPFFNGQIAEVAIWDQAVDLADVIEMKRNGMGSASDGLTDQWVLNDIPEEISETTPSVFSDAGNLATPTDFARYYNGSTLALGFSLANSAPLLFSWDDDNTIILTNRENLAVGLYTFDVKDIFGCGRVFKEFNILNGDDEKPYFIWNVSVGKTASQSTLTVGDVCGYPMEAGLATDGLYDDGNCSYTTTETEPANESWWEVDLGVGKVVPVSAVVITPYSSDLSDFFIFISASPFPVGGRLADDLASGAAYLHYSGTVTAGSHTYIPIPSSPQGRYIRVRMATVNQPLWLTEVEALTSYLPVSTRYLYLTDDCNYTITDNDATIDPIQVDACGEVPSREHDIIDAVDRGTLLDYSFSMGPHPVTWTSYDENGIYSDNFTITYEVVDTVRPVFLENPFAGFDSPLRLTNCEAQNTFSFPIPRVSDNYGAFCGASLKSISLYRGPHAIYSVPNIATYDPDNPGANIKLPASMLPGEYVYSWLVIDANDNERSVSHTIYVEEKPVLQEVKVSPNRCFNSDDGVVYFSNVTYEAGQDVQYILVSTTAPYTEYTNTNNPVFTVSRTLPQPDGTVPPGRYIAYIEVNGCRTLRYPFDIVLTNPIEITLPATGIDITHVVCYGNNDGAIDISPDGGSQTNVLHLIGPDTYATAPTYTSISNLTTLGTIEAWVFIDDLVDGGLNWNAGLFGIHNNGNGYGLRLTNGVPAFMVGGQSVSVAVPPASLVRNWIRLVGQWNGTLATPELTLTVSDFNGGSWSATANPATLSATATAGSVCFGCLGNGLDANNLRGFIRNARIWNAYIDATLLAQNYIMSDPIDPGGNLIANYPINAAGGTSLVNQENSSNPGTVTGTFARQRFAYYWLDPLGDPVESNPPTPSDPFLQDISNVEAGIYTVNLYDPLGCTASFSPEILTDDKAAPAMTFYSDHDRTTTLTLGDPIIRTTGQTDWGNTANDCEFVPSADEFEPTIFDNGCPTGPEYITLWYELLSGDDFLDKPDPDPMTDLDGRRMTGIMTLRWYAQDRNNPPTTQDVIYYIVDNEPPVAGDLVLANATVELNGTTCTYIVGAGDFIPANLDECATGILSNDRNGQDNLGDVPLSLGDNIITWTYQDRIFPDIAPTPPTTFAHTITVIDNSMPQAVCKDVVPVLHLDALGRDTLQSLELDNESYDNCGAISNLVLSKNIAYPISAAIFSDPSDASASLDHNTDPTSYAISAQQANPWWQIDLGANYTVLGVHLYAGNGAALENFWVLVSTASAFDHSGDWTPAGAVFGANVLHAQYFAGTVAVDELIELTKVTLPGQYVSIVLNNNDAQLCLSEVKIFGTSNISKASKLGVECSDIRYTPNADPYIKGVFGPIDVLLTAIDYNNNAGSCLRSAIVRDDLPPVVNVTNAAIPLSPNRGESIDLNTEENIDLIDAGSTDNCTLADDLTRWVTPNNPVTCANIGNYSVVLHVMDQYANQYERSVVITINDIDGPTMTTRLPEDPATSLELQLGPDGYYDVQVTDLITAWEDNCTDDDVIRFTINPSRVTCSQRGDHIDISITATDGNGQSNTLYFYAVDETVLVSDTLDPEFSLSDHTLIITSAGTGVIHFDDLVEDGNLHDNCTPVDDLLRFIRYDVPEVEPDEWCAYGYEGGASSAIENIAHLATSIQGSAPQTGYPYSNLNDYKPSGDVETSDQTYYTTNAVYGERTLRYNFGKTFEFESIDALWVNNTSSDGNTALSHNDTYMPAANIASSGGAVGDRGLVRDFDNGTSMSMETGTGGTDAFTIDYTFTQRVMVANVRLRWATGSDLQSNTIIQYHNGTDWVPYGVTIQNSTDGASIAIINATTSITRIRLVYDPVAGNTPEIAEWYVYGQPCTERIEWEPTPIGSSPGIIQLSHTPNYVKAITCNDNSDDRTNINDAAGTSTRYFANNSEAAYGEWVVYEFQQPITITSTSIFWYENGTTAQRPTQARIEYSLNGSSWTSAGAIGVTANNYNNLVNLSISAKYLRVSFTRREYWWSIRNAAIADWIVTGHPCGTINMPSSEDLSFDNDLLPNANISANNNNANSNKLADTNLSTDPYVTIVGGWTDITVNYSFTEEIVLESFTIYWFNRSNRIRNVNVQYEEGGSWYNVVAQFTPGTNTSSYTGYSIPAQNFRIRFQARDNSAADPGIYEWVINGYAPSDITYSDCWEPQEVSYWDDVTVTTQIPVVPPTVASVEYSNDWGATWSDPITVDNDAFPTGVNRTYLHTSGVGNVVEANALRLTFDNTITEGNIGLYEWRANGRRIPQEGENDEDACFTYDCSHVQQDVTVYLRAVDESYNEGIVSVDVPVLPYFTIETIDIKDCGYSGERYYPTISNLSSTLSYTYTWSEIDDYGTDEHQSLFLEYHDPELGDACPRFPNDDLTTYTMTKAGQDWIELNTTACTEDLQDGSYRIKLRVQDNNSPSGCWDDKFYDFDYDGSESTAKSVDSMEYCIGDIETFQIKFPINTQTTGLSNNQFFKQSTMQYFWYDYDNMVNTNLSSLESSGLITVLFGGKSFGESGTTYGDNYVTLQFDKATRDNLNKTTDLNYSYKAESLAPYHIFITSTDIEVGDGTPVDGYSLIILSELESGGIYFTADDPVDDQIVPDGVRYIRLDREEVWDPWWGWYYPSWFYGDYGACMEKRIFRNTVYRVDVPIIEATRDLTGATGWVTITGTGAQLFPICVRDTILYRVENYDDADFDHLDWSWMSDEIIPEATGRRLSGGNSDDRTITMIWDSYTEDEDKMPRLTIKGYNALNCTSDEAEVNHTFDDDTNPVLDCSDMNKVHDNAPTQCGYTFTNLPPPLMTDNCYNRIASYWCTIGPDSIGHNAGGYYPVGETQVVWHAKDYSNNEGTCIQTITILDTEAPRWLVPPPANLDNQTANADCEYVHSGTVQDVTAEDYCVANNAWVASHTVAQVYGFNSVNGLYDILATNQPPTDGTLAGTVFELGRWRVEWTTTDGVNNSAYNTAEVTYDPEGNKNTLDFFIQVNDNTAPVVTDIDGNSANGTQIAAITANTDPTHPGTTFDIITPLYDGTAFAHPNQLYYPGYTIVMPGGLTAALTDPNGIYLDNCNPDNTLTVSFVSRSDNKTTLGAEFLSGITTITWRISDPNGNTATFYQDVIVSDNEPPEFTSNAEFAPASISYCQRTGYRIPIPRSYYDNVRVEQLHYSVTNEDNDVILSGTLDRSLTPNFTVGGVAFLASYAFSDNPADDHYVDPVNGSDFTVTWTASDAVPNTSDPVAGNDSYTLHVEMQPRYTELDAPPTQDCNGEATISVVISDENTATYRYDRNHGYAPEFNFGFGWQPSNSFTATTGATYTVRMRVNNCVAPDVFSKSIATFNEYRLTSAMTEASCPEVWDGRIDLTLTGGVPGQLVFNGGAGYTVADHDQIDLTSEGALEAWIYLSGTSDATFLNKGTEYGLRVTSQQIVLFAGTGSLTSTTTLATDRWYHVSAWWAPNQMNIIIDGTASTTSAAAFTAPVATADILQIGTGFTGILREARVWNEVDAAFDQTGAIRREATKIVGNESGLAGFWDMNEGAGTQTFNRCYTYNSSWARHAYGSNTLWQANHPQPGFYTWTKNTNPFDVAIGLSNIKLTGLEVADYGASYEDPYGCTAVSETYKTVLAGDILLPEFDYSPMTGAPVLYVSDGVCYYDFVNADAVELYTPDISDLNCGNCDFTTEWLVVYTATNETSLFYDEGYYDQGEDTPEKETHDAKILGARLRNEGGDGRNTVYINAKQNSMEMDPRESYILEVLDNQRPTAVGKFAQYGDLYLDANGRVTIQASDFNLSSSDNCTKDPGKLQPRLATPTPEEVANGTFDEYDPNDYAESVDLDCDDRNSTVRLYFLVTDESGNSNYETRADQFNIFDLIAPEFVKTTTTLPSVCATVSESGGIPAYTTFAEDNLIDLLPEDYSDNCEVTGVRFKIQHLTYNLAPYNNDDDYEYFGFPAQGIYNDAAVDMGGNPIPYYEGYTQITFQLHDESGNPVEQLIYIVHVLPKPEPGTIE